MTDTANKPDLTRRISLKVSWEWRDMWIGAFWDRDERVLYVCPLPTVLLTFVFRDRTEDPTT